MCPLISTQFLVLSAFCIDIVHFVELMDHYWYIVTNQSPWFSLEFILRAVHSAGLVRGMTSACFPNITQDSLLG